MSFFVVIEHFNLVLMEIKVSSKKRHIAKTITWRVVGTLDTIILSWIITGSPSIGLKIGLVEVITKMVLYYFHERIWFNFTLKNANKRHILKTLTWRAVGTIDTIILSWIITGDPIMGLNIGSAELVTKMILYYLHEKVWYRVNYGLNKKRSSTDEKLYN